MSSDTDGEGNDYSQYDGDKVSGKLLKVIWNRGENQVILDNL
jgi:hypothetical protein